MNSTVGVWVFGQILPGALAAPREGEGEEAGRVTRHMVWSSCSSTQVLHRGWVVSEVVKCWLLASLLSPGAACHTAVRLLLTPAWWEVDFVLFDFKICLFSS